MASTRTELLEKPLPYGTIVRASDGYDDLNRWTALVLKNGKMRMLRIGYETGYALNAYYIEYPDLATLLECTDPHWSISTIVRQKLTDEERAASQKRSKAALMAYNADYRKAKMLVAPGMFFSIPDRRWKTGGSFTITIPVYNKVHILSSNETMTFQKFYQQFKATSSDFAPAKKI